MFIIHLRVHVFVDIPFDERFVGVGVRNKLDWIVVLEQVSISEIYLLSGFQCFVALLLEGSLELPLLIIDIVSANMTDQGHSLEAYAAVVVGLVGRLVDVFLRDIHEVIAELTTFGNVGWEFG